ncbi:hypothetical protein OESDEN_08033 [Oesophagostomum dentatum]|uniref:Uncharacterized protein n=1 Tax=Oesophagostomum dentatum TaxID=61180 RepID=A0A0B1T8H0_OESDE|nr:hypothetical protein OESDEN_08033 [Oesophagostomum dentatum]
MIYKESLRSAFLSYRNTAAKLATFQGDALLGASPCHDMRLAVGCQRVRRDDHQFRRRAEQLATKLSEAPLSRRASSTILLSYSGGEPILS